jgi:hypothetical protein
MSSFNGLMKNANFMAIVEMELHSSWKWMVST